MKLGQLSCAAKHFGHQTYTEKYGPIGDVSSQHDISMKIGHILIIAPSAYPLGGVATWIDYVVPGLRRLGWQVTLGLTEGTHHNVNAYLAAHPMQEVVRIRNGTGTREGRIRSLCAAITAVGPNIVASVNIPDVYSAAGRLKRSGFMELRVVMTLHGLDADYFEQVKRDAPSLDAVIATNRLACKLASSIGGLESHKIYHAPYGVHIPASLLPNKKDNTIRVGFIGRLEKPQKRVDELLAITREMDRQNIGYQLLIAGEGPAGRWLRSELKSNIDRGKVKFLGALSGREVENLYGAIDTLLITSRWETGPIVAWEAMAHGILVVTSAYIGSGLEGNLHHGDNCLMYPLGNAAAAVECIVQSENIELRRRLTKAAFAFVRERMSHERSIEIWSQCFVKIKAQPVQRPFVENKQHEPAGRLDRLLGPRLGETARRVLHRQRVPSEPGEEWPHISVTSQLPEEIFWHLARAADVENAGTVQTGNYRARV